MFKEIKLLAYPNTKEAVFILILRKTGDRQTAAKECELPEVDEGHSSSSIDTEYSHTWEGGYHT